MAVLFPDIALTYFNQYRIRKILNKKGFICSPANYYRIDKRSSCLRHKGGDGV